MEAKYGYVITSTPGTVDDGVFALSATGIKLGDIRLCDIGERIATWHSNDSAEAAMLALVPAGSNPSVYAGLAIASAFDIAPNEAANDFVEWMD